MTQLMTDILAQPGELRKILSHMSGAGRSELGRATRLLRPAAHLYISGIGSSWHAGMAMRSFFDRAGRPAILVDSAEFLHFTEVPGGDRGRLLICIPRSFRDIMET